MSYINMHDAKTRLSQLVEAVESGETDEIVIARNGRPVARLVPIAAIRKPALRIGIAKGLFTAPADPRDGDEEIAALFTGSAD